MYPTVAVNYLDRKFRDYHNLHSALKKCTTGEDFRYAHTIVFSVHYFLSGTLFLENNVSFWIAIYICYFNCFVAAGYWLIV